jgi:hypothetical protein
MMKNVNLKNKDEEEDDEEDEEGDDDDDEEEMAQLPRVVLKRVLALRKMHSELDELDKQYKAERILLEQKYLERKVENYNMRTKIVSGEVEPQITEDTEKALVDGSKILDKQVAKPTCF